MKPLVSVALLPSHLPTNWQAGHSCAVVIDTLRFTSTACTALAAGAAGVRVVSDIDRARQLAAGSSDSVPGLLCGERNCVRIDGFHLGNSPAEYTPDIVAGRELIFSTTNGTVAVEAASIAAQVLLGCLLNRQALTAWIDRWAQQVEDAHLWLICAGTDGHIALEDVATAGAIIEALDWEMTNDSAWLAFNSWQYIKHSGCLLKQFQMARGGANLIASGFAEDIKLVAHVDTLPVVPGLKSTGRFEVLTLS